jgi:outer membrane biosynthesis protein TonB
MAVPCGSQTRLIRSDILDKDMFDATTKTPEHTSWTMSLVRRLDDAVGPGVMEKPAFLNPKQDAQPSKEIDPETRQSLNAGKHDALFPNAPEKPSDILRAALAAHPKPAPTLLNISPYAPQRAPLPNYPPLALATHTQGDVTFSVEIDQMLGAGNITVLTGHPLLRQAVVDAVKGWQFAPEALGKKSEGTISFKLNCSPKPN